MWNALLLHWLLKVFCNHKKIKNNNKIFSTYLIRLSMCEMFYYCIDWYDCWRCAMSELSNFLREILTLVPTKYFRNKQNKYSNWYFKYLQFKSSSFCIFIYNATDSHELTFQKVFWHYWSLGPVILGEPLDKISFPYTERKSENIQSFFKVAKTNFPPEVWILLCGVQYKGHYN